MASTSSAFLGKTFSTAFSEWDFFVKDEENKKIYLLSSGFGTSLSKYFNLGGSVNLGYFYYSGTRERKIYTRDTNDMGMGLVSRETSGNSSTNILEQAITFSYTAGVHLILEVHQIGLVYQGAHIPLLNDSERQEIQSLSFSFDPDMMGFKFSEISHDRTGAERKPYENFPSWVTAAYGFNLKDFKLNLETSFYFKNGSLLKENILNFRIGSEWALSS